MRVRQSQKQTHNYTSRYERRRTCAPRARGESAIQALTITCSTLSPGISLINSVVVDFCFFFSRNPSAVARHIQHGVHHVEYLDTLLAQIRKEREKRTRKRCTRSLSSLHAVGVHLQAELLISRLGSVEPNCMSGITLANQGWNELVPHLNESVHTMFFLHREHEGVSVHKS